jgi:hypothetical protein
MPTNTYEFLKQIAKGEDSGYNRWNYPDDLIHDIRINEKNPLASQITLDFDKDSDFLEILGVDENDAWTYNYIMYDDSSDWDWYTYRDEWKEGYILDGFNNENKEKFEKIVRLSLSPKTSVRSDILNGILGIYENQVENIISAYANENERCQIDGAKEIIRRETEKPFDRFGIIEVWYGSRFKTTVGILLNWYRMLKMEDDDIKHLLKSLFEKYNPKSDIGGWEEIRYNSFCDDYDSEGVQREIGFELDKIIEEIEEDGINEDFQKLYDTVVKLGGFNNHIELKDKEMSVVFQSIDPHTGRLVFKIFKKGGESEQRSVDNLEDLYLNLYQPELFESVKDILNRIL